MQIPIYGNEEVAPNEMPGVQVQPITDAAGEAALGQGIEHLGEGADKLGAAALDAYKQHSKAAAADAFNSWQRDASAPLYGTTAESRGGSEGAPSASQSRGDAAFSGVNGGGLGPPGFTRSGSSDTLPEGLFNAQGQRAAAAGGPTMDYLGKRAAEVEDSLGNPIAKQYFRQMVQPQLAEYHRQIEVHSAQQLKAAKELTEQTTAKTSFGNIAAGVDNATTPEDVFTVTQAAIDPVHKTIDALNPDTAVAAAKKAAYDQEAYYGVVKQLVDEKRDPVSAEAFLKSHEKEIAYGENGRDRVGHLREAIDRLKGIGEGDTVTQQIAKDATLPTGRHDLAKMYGSLQALPAGTPDHVKEAVRQGIHAAEEQDRQTVDNLYGQVVDQYIRGGQDATKVAPTLLTQLEQFDPPTAQKFLKMAEQDARERVRPEKPEKPTDDQKMREWEFEDQLHADPTAAQGLTVSGLDRQLRGDDGKLLVTRDQEDRMMRSLSVVHGQKPPPGSLAPELKQRMMTGVDAQVPGKGDQAKRIRAFVKDAVIDQLEADAKAGKKITADDVDKVVAQKLVKVPLKGSGLFGFFQDKVPVGQLERDPALQGREADAPDQPAQAPAAPQAPAAAPAPSVPKETADVIRAQYKKLGKDLTDDQVATVYAKFQARQAGSKPAPAAPAAAPALLHPVVAQAIQAAPPVDPEAGWHRKPADDLSSVTRALGAGEHIAPEPEKPKEKPRAVGTYRITKE